MKKFLAMLGIGLVGIVGVAAPSASADYPPAAPQITASSSTVASRGPVTYTVTGFCAGTTVTFKISPNGTVIGTAVADAGGNASVTIKAPKNKGTYTVTATGAVPCLASASTTITVRSLPATGSDATSFGIQGGAVALVAGGALVGLAALRRRRPLAA
ncbi:hypothetical protein BH10ACT2_BH10ACT2_21040 [soil metagenome]